MSIRERKGKNNYNDAIKLTIEDLKRGVEFPTGLNIYSKESMQAHDSAIRREFAEKIIIGLPAMSYSETEAVVAHIRAMAEEKE